MLNVWKIEGPFFNLLSENRFYYFRSSQILNENALANYVLYMNNFILFRALNSKKKTFGVTYQKLGNSIIMWHLT